MCVRLFWKPNFYLCTISYIRHSKSPPTTLAPVRFTSFPLSLDFPSFDFLSPQIRIHGRNRSWLPIVRELGWSTPIISEIFTLHCTRDCCANGLLCNNDTTNTNLRMVIYATLHHIMSWLWSIMCKNRVRWIRNMPISPFDIHRMPVNNECGELFDVVDICMPDSSLVGIRYGKAHWDLHGFWKSSRKVRRSGDAYR